MRLSDKLIFSLGGLAILLLSLPAYGAKVSGLIVDESSEPLPFVSVVSESRNYATTSNVRGQYVLELPDGVHTLTFRCIGYKTYSRTITVSGTDLVMDVTLSPQTYQIIEATVNAGGEDPAYPIIRKAQSRRKFYKDQVSKYSCDAYIKGVAGVINAPEKILGINITLDGLDSSRSGIVYLSESVSTYHFQAPNKEKEIMISSKVSGTSQGFSWNSALEFKLDFYESLVPTPITSRDVISPIAPDAMMYYRYKLEGTYYEGSQEIYNIRIIPKLTGGPLVNGTIQIQEGSWRIHSTDLYLTKENGMEFLDTLFIKQIYVPVTDSIWMRGSQSFTFNFNVKLFNVKGKGYFLGTFSDYDLAPEFPPRFFSGEIIKVQEESNKKSDAYWDSIRPIPLTEEETADYQLKDSLEKVRETKAYKDSVDRISNRFKPLNLLFGYTWENSYRNISLNFSSPIRDFQFNTVEGITLEEKIRFTKSFREKKARFSAEVSVRYGFSGQRFYGKAAVQHRFNATNRMTIRAEGGRYITQYNESQPISHLANSLYTIFLEENYFKAYEKTYGQLEWGRELWNGIRLRVYTEFANRKPLINAPNLTRFYINWDSREFTSNNPQMPLDDTPAFTENNSFKAGLSLRLRFGQKFMSRPGLKINMESKWPQVELSYEKAIAGVAGSKPNYDFLKIGVFQEINTGILGYSEYFASYGVFVNRADIPFTDFHHFNTTRVIFAPQDELRSFWTMPYYTRSTDHMYVEVHYQHHFMGWFLGKIPGIKKLKWQEVVGFHFLWTPEHREYYEMTVGLENIFRIIRIDFVAAFGPGEYPYFSGRVKLKL